MMLNCDSTSLVNLIFCIVIIIITIYGYYRIKNPVVLFIGAGFTAFAVSHIISLLEVKDLYQVYFIIIRVLGYILITIGVYYVILEVIHRTDAENNLRKSYEQTENRIQERTADLEKVNVALSEEIERRISVEKTLRESEEKYREFFTTSRDGVFITSPEGVWFDYNTAMMEMAGYENLEEMAQSRSSDLYSNPDDRRKLLDMIREKGYVEEYPVRMKRRDGTLFDSRITSVPLWNADGSINSFFGTLRDVTERNRAERALRDLKFIVQHSPAIAFVWKAVEGWPVEYVSENIDQFGYSSEDFLSGRVIYSDIIHPDDHARIVDEVTGYSAEEGRDEFVQEYRIITGDKQVRWIDDRTWIRRDGTGMITHYQGIILDITKRKQNEEALSESEARLHSIIQGTPMLQFVIDRDHRVISWNKAMEMYSGIKSSEVLGTRDQWRAFYETERPVLADLVMENRKEILSEWYPDEFTNSRFIEGAFEATDFFHNMGESGKWLSLTAAPIRDAGGAIIGAVETLEDITERTLAQQALIRVNKKLTMLNSITRHDILNQLTVLKGYLGLSSEFVTDPVLLEYIRRENLATEAIQWQIEFTRNYQDIGSQSPKWQYLSETINSATMQLRPSGVEFTISVAGVEIYADPLIEKVFYNLIENSLRHGVHVTVIGFSVQETENGLILAYVDNGVGIDTEDKGKLFRKGFGKHTGLGLFLSKEILSITGISIMENGEPGKGVRFEMLVPKGVYREI